MQKQCYYYKTTICGTQSVTNYSETGVYWHRVCGSDEKHLMIKEKESKVYTTLATYYKLR